MAGQRCGCDFTGRLPRAGLRTRDWYGDAFDTVVNAREADADEFYRALAPSGTTPDEMQILRQACAGLVWSKQIYPYNVRRWLDGDPGEPPPPEAHRHGRNSGWRHLDSFDILAMPDPWEYPWFAAWDSGFHAVPWAHLDPAFAKYQVVVLLREWFLHPNGALPAYEWNFDDVNPPVHVMAALRVFVIDGSRDREFLERVFQKLLVNFTWWLNRQDADGNNVFSGGFLGLDNISPIDRSNLPAGVSLEQADGTAWMAYYALSMLVIALELAAENEVYEDMVVKFLEQFLLIARALESQDLFDAEDGAFYDRLVRPSGERVAIKVQTIAGLIPILPAASMSIRADQAPVLAARLARLRTTWEDLGGTMVGRVRELGDHRNVLISVIAPDRLRLALREFFDESAFLSPHGLRSLSKRHDGQPYTIEGVEGATIDYQAAESTTSMFGGNSNWRGPVWMPLNYLAIRSFVQFQRFLGDDFTVEYPTGSGQQRTFDWVAQDLADRIIAIWTPGPDGRARLRRHRQAAGGSRLEGQPPVLRVLQRRQRSRARRDAPDRLDGTRGRPHPRSAASAPSVERRGESGSVTTSTGSAMSAGCPACGFLNTGDAVFCGRCGGVLGPTCSACGAGPLAPGIDLLHRVRRRAGPLGGRPGAQGRRASSSSTSSASRAWRRALDPEDVRRVLDPYYRRAREELERYGGTVEKFIGDAVMALFGSPVSHEDDPERAVRAAYAVREAVHGLASGEDTPALQVRIGITTGEAVVDVNARPDEGKATAHGDVVNTAARLQTGAPVDAILVDERTYRATRFQIDFHSEPPLHAKGKAQPLPVWSVVTPRGRTGTDRSHHDRRLVGREHETQVLADALADGPVRGRAADGDAGRPARASASRARCGSSTSASSRAPTSSSGGRAGRCPTATASPSGRWPRSSRATPASSRPIPPRSSRRSSGSRSRTSSRTPTRRAGSRATCRPWPGSPRARELRGDHRIEAFTAWRRFLEEIAARSPLVLVFEDMHWADDSLLEFIADHLGGRFSGRLLVLVTCRPELIERRPGWGSGQEWRRRSSSWRRCPTTRRRGWWPTCSRRPTSRRSFARRLLASAGGNPLFAEEYVRMLLDRGLLRTAGAGPELAGSELPMPESVQSIIAARLDALPVEEKLLVQDAAVVGRAFWLGALSEIGAGQRWSVEHLLHELERKQLVRQGAQLDRAQRAAVLLLPRRRPRRRLRADPARPPLREAPPHGRLAGDALPRAERGPRRDARPPLPAGAALRACRRAARRFAGRGGQARPPRRGRPVAAG